MNSFSLMWSLLFGSIGLGYFMYGKKRSDPVIRYSGLLLMIYPYFVSNTIVMVLVGLGLMLAPKFVKL